MDTRKSTVSTTVDAVPPPSVVMLRDPADQQLARDVIGKLQTHPALNVCTLVVHRCQSGLCIEGHIQVMSPSVSIAALLAEIDTTIPILNRVMVSTPPGAEVTSEN